MCTTYNEQKWHTKYVMSCDGFICSENVMKITLWGDQAINFNIDAVYDSEVGNLVLCLVVGCTAREDFKNKGDSLLSACIKKQRCV